MKSSEQAQLHNFIRLIMTAAANAALYDIDHRQVLRFNKQAMQALEQLIGSSGELTLRLINGQLIHANKPLTGSLSVERLITLLSRRGISYLNIVGGVYAEELLSLIQILSQGPLKEIDIHDSKHIHFGRIEVRYRQSALEQSAILSLADISSVEAERINDLYDTIQHKHQIELTGISEIVNSFVQSFSQQGNPFLALAPLRAIDEYTYTHSTNICLLNIAQAKALGIEGQLLNDIGIAAMLHDVGKMFISPSILTKTEALNEEEWNIMKQHPRLGAEYLLTVPGVPKLAIITAYEHHMHYDQTGYPEVGPSWKQHFCSYMTAISDTYDAMRTNRAYEKALDLNQIIDIMHRLAGSRLHPQLTYNFLYILKELDPPSQNSS